MQSWENATAIDFSQQQGTRKKRVVFNTSVGKGKLNGTVVYVMAYEWSRPGTPGGWNTNFALSTDLKSWDLLDDEVRSEMANGSNYISPVPLYDSNSLSR